MLRNSIIQGLDNQVISTITDLSIEEIENVKRIYRKSNYKFATIRFRIANPEQQV